MTACVNSAPALHYQVRSMTIVNNGEALGPYEPPPPAVKAEKAAVVEVEPPSPSSVAMKDVLMKTVRPAYRNDMPGLLSTRL